MGNEADILRLFAETDRVFGPLTGLVNNAALSAGRSGASMRITFAGAMEVMRVNVAGTVAVRARGDPAHVDEEWRQGRRDRERVFARRADRLAECLHRLCGLQRRARHDDHWARSRDGRLRHPGECGAAGLIDTEIHNEVGIPDRVKRFGPKMPIGRAGEAREVAEAIVWLLSDKASYVTGDFINVTGGAR